MVGLPLSMRSMVFTALPLWLFGLDGNNMDNELAKAISRSTEKVLHRLEVLIVAEEEKQIGYVPY